MKIPYTLIFTLLVIFNSIDLSSQSDRNSDGKRNPDTSRYEASRFPDRRYFPERSPPPEEPSLRARSRSVSPVEPPLRARSSTPFSRGRGRPSLSIIPRHGQVELIRLIPRSNPNRSFVFRRYTFPPGKPIQLGLKYNIYEQVPIPTQEQIVLSTPDGDVIAVLNNATALVGIYNIIGQRAQINMDSGTVEQIRTEIAIDCPVGKRIPISKNYIIERDSLDLNQ